MAPEVLILMVTEKAEVKFDDEEMSAIDGVNCEIVSRAPRYFIPG